MTKFSPGDRVESGNPGTDDHDTGVVQQSPERALKNQPPEKSVWVSWDSGVKTWAMVNDLRRVR